MILLFLWCDDENDNLIMFIWDMLRLLLGYFKALCLFPW